MFLNWIISTEAPDHGNLVGANPINGKLGNLPHMVPIIWASSSLEISRNHDLFMFNPTYKYKSLDMKRIIHHWQTKILCMPHKMTSFAF